MEEVDNTVINIQPKTIIKTNTVTCFKSSVVSHELFNSITFAVNMCDANGSLIDVQYVTLTGTDYTNNINVSGLTTTIAQKLELTM